MARIEGSSGNLAEVDAGSLAQRASIRPMRTTAWNGMAGISGLLTGIAAGGRIFSFRNSSTNLILVRRIGIGFMTTTAFTAAQAIDFGLAIARAFTVADSAGAGRTDLSPTLNLAKYRTSLATPNVQASIAGTAVISGGTLTADTLYAGMAAGGSAGLATGLAPAPDNLFQQSTGDLPLVLAANEGFVINNLTLMGAVGVLKAYVNVEYAEVAPAEYA